METQEKKLEVLFGHFSESTAYVVDDYPYGFRLRCKIRYWVEWTKHGARMVSQTTNPKREGTHWNAPKKSTYSDLMVMTKDPETGYISATGVSLEYTSAEFWQAWLDKNASGLPDLKQVQVLLNNAKIIFEARKHIKVVITKGESLDLSALMRKDPEALATAERIKQDQEERKKKDAQVARLVLGHAQKVTGLKLQGAQ